MVEAYESTVVSTDAEMESRCEMMPQVGQRGEDAIKAALFQSSEFYQTNQPQ